jgi:flagellar biosynthesis/type III secretory pathway protein FliH
VIQELTIRVPAGLRDVVLVDAAAPLGPVENHMLHEQRQALRTVLGKLMEVAGELQDQRRQRLEEMQQVAVEIALAVASRLVHEKLEKADSGVEELVRQAVQRLNTSQPITIALHPKDLDLLQNRSGKAVPLSADGGPLRMIGDPSLNRGDCRADAGDTSLLADVQEQLADIRRHLLETLPEATLDRRKPLPPERPFKRFPERRQTA